MSASLLDARAIGFHHGDHTVLSDVDLQVGAASRIAIVGPNGSGKSTLLRILAGELRPHAGIVRHARPVAYLPQRAGTADNGGADATSMREAILAAARGAAPWEADRAAERLGLGDDVLDRPLGAVSGGQAARAGLAALTVARGDVLLLDEPTNDLDADGLRRLEAIIEGHRGGIVLISHDRALLGRVSDRVLELDRRTGTATAYAGGWDAYERTREAAQAHAIAAHDDALAARERLAGAERKTRRRAAASARKARRGGRDNDKHSREWVTARAEEMAGRARKIGTRAARITVPERPWADAPLALTLTPGERRQAWVVALDGVVLQRGMWRRGPLDLAVAPGERVLLSGANGTGKSTLLATLAGRLRPAAGRRRSAAGSVIAEIGQRRDALHTGVAVWEAVRDLTGAEEAPARTALARFGLACAEVVRPAGTLSPGERTRAELAVLSLLRPTCLLLDEPTNHLDVGSLQTVEAALAGWPGALVVATHDERLRETLALEREVRL